MLRFKNDEEIAKLVESLNIADPKKTDAGNFSRLLTEMVGAVLAEQEESTLITDKPEEWQSAVEAITSTIQNHLEKASHPEDETGQTKLIQPGSKLSYHGDAGKPIRLAKINMRYPERGTASEWAIINLAGKLGRWTFDAKNPQPTGELQKGGIRLTSNNFTKWVRKRQVPATVDILFKSGGGGRANYATVFEGNIAYGLSSAAGLESTESLHNKLKGKKGHIDEDPMAMKAGKKIGGVLMPQIEKALGSMEPPLTFQSVGKQSGGDDKKKDAPQSDTDDDAKTVKKSRKKASGLTKTYTKYGVKSGESKADLVFNNSVGVSVKKAGGSQYSSAQAPETAALFEVAFREVGKERAELEAEIENMGSFILETMGRPGVGKAYDYRDNALHVAQADGAQIEGYQKSLGKILGMSMESAANRLDLTDEDKQGFVNALTGQAFSAADKLKPIVTKILASDDFRKAVFKEAVTGNNKFADDKDKAKAMLVWNYEKPETSTYENLTDGWFSAHYGGLVKFGVRDRGGRRDGKGGRGMALRIEPVEPKEAEGKPAPKQEPETTQDQEALQEWYLHEKYFNFSEVQVLSEGAVSDELIEEGIKDALKWAGSAWTKGVDWAKEQIATLVGIVKEAASKFVQYLKNVLKEGFSKFLEFVGFEFEETAWQL